MHVPVYIFVFKLNDDKTKVRRKTPIQELKDLDEKTVYVVSMYNSAQEKYKNN